MSQLGTTALLTKFDQLINTNGIEDITGAEMNEILHDIADSFYNKTDTLLGTLDNLTDGDIPYFTSNNLYGSPMSASASSVIFKSGKTLTTWALKALLTFGSSGDQFNFTTDNGNGSESGINLAPTFSRMFSNAGLDKLTLGSGIAELRSSDNIYLRSPTSTFYGDIILDGSLGYAKSISYQIGSTQMMMFFGDDSSLTLYNTSTGQWQNGFEITPNSFTMSVIDSINSCNTSFGVLNDYVTVRGTKAGFSGIIYDSDYSVNYTLRSLVDKGYVQGNYLKLSGGTVTGPILYSGIPNADAELVNRAYVWDLVNGIDYKDNVLAATTANITLSGIQTIDGVAGADGMRILVKDQTDQTENGIYLMRSGAWERSSDGDTGVKLEWAVVAIGGSGTQAGLVYRCNQNAITIGSTNIVWSDWTRATYYAGSYLTLTGSTFNINFSSFTSDAITEGSTNLFFTNARARSAISSTSPVSYNNSTGVISMAAATSSVNGYLSSSDWSVFDGKNNLTQNYIAYGNASNKITGSTNFTFDGSSLSMGDGIQLKQGAYTGTSIYGALKNTSGTIRWIDFISDNRDAAKNAFVVETTESGTIGATTAYVQSRSAAATIGVQANNTSTTSLFLTSSIDSTYGLSAGSSITSIGINKTFRPTGDKTFDLGTSTRRWSNIYARQIIAYDSDGTLLTDTRIMTTETTVFNFSTGAATGTSNNSFKQVYNFTNDAGTTTYFIGANLRVKNLVTPTAGSQEIGFIFETNYLGTVAERMRVNGTGILIADGHSLQAGTTSGLKIGSSTSQKIGLWNATPIAQPTTAISSSTFTANSGTAVNDASTFDGYTIGQIVKALRNMGALA